MCGFERGFAADFISRKIRGRFAAWLKPSPDTERQGTGNRDEGLEKPAELGFVLSHPSEARMGHPLLKNRLNSCPSIGESFEIVAPIEHVPSWPRSVGKNLRPDGYANTFKPRKRAKSGLPNLLDGDDLGDKMPDSKDECIHFPTIGGGELTGVINGLYSDIARWFLIPQIQMLTFFGIS